MIIIPDVHGRVFWKSAVEQRKPGEKVVFLGDYLEPYTSQDAVTHEMAYKNFLEILEYKKSHKRDCILLLGNHDFACIDSSMISCRHDYANAARNTATFRDNISLFQLAYMTTIEGKEYWFTHSGIHKDWYEYMGKKGKSKNTHPIKYLNNKFKKDMDGLLSYLGIYSRYRGFSPFDFGSCIWADVREWSETEAEYENVYQIFGHTQLKDVIITNHFADLDARRGFRLNEETGKIEELKNGK